ncbi:hypothetical protein BWI17_15655 [Betaproteobacteria bacterium GR16-43]|nr:hypothetical protein BWI17_15655 [Betaproteobacteria bacterium GR16-43]
MRVQRFGLAIIALATIGGCATERASTRDRAPAPDLTALQTEFLAGIASLKVPEFGWGYVQNLERIGTPETLAQRDRFFADWRSRVAAIPRNTLDREMRPRYDALLFEIEFNLERLRLESRFALARTEPIPADGLAKLPDAPSWYALHLKRNASRETTPDALFAFGEAEVARIRGEMRRVQDQMGYAGRDAEWRERLRSQVVTDPDAVAARFMRVRDTVQAALPRYFLPRDVRPPPIEPAPNATKDTPPGYYTNGVFYFGFFGGRFPARSFGWLYLHEAMPGHHYQLSLPSRAADGFSYPASVEGWGAYCEDLGSELGVYADPDLLYGKWEWDLVRSARVALDVGIHAKGWTREQALAYWRANVPDQEDIAVREVDRVTRWPAQVVSYKVGEKALLDLRSELATRQGAAFDIRDFHARVLALGSLPVSALERAMRESPD